MAELPPPPRTQAGAAVCSPAALCPLHWAQGAARVDSQSGGVATHAQGVATPGQQAPSTLAAAVPAAARVQGEEHRCAAAPHTQVPGCMAASVAAPAAASTVAAARPVHAQLPHARPLPHAMVGAGTAQRCSSCPCPACVPLLPAPPPPGMGWRGGRCSLATSPAAVTRAVPGAGAGVGPLASAAAPAPALASGGSRGAERAGAGAGAGGGSRGSTSTGRRRRGAGGGKLARTLTALKTRRRHGEGVLLPGGGAWKGGVATHESTHISGGRFQGQPLMQPPRQRLGVDTAPLRLNFDHLGPPAVYTVRTPLPRGRVPPPASLLWSPAGDAAGGELLLRHLLLPQSGSRGDTREHSKGRRSSSSRRSGSSRAAQAEKAWCASDAGAASEAASWSSGGERGSRTSGGGSAVDSDATAGTTAGYSSVSGTSDADLSARDGGSSSRRRRSSSSSRRRRSSRHERNSSNSSSRRRSTAGGVPHRSSRRSVRMKAVPPPCTPAEALQSQLLQQLEPGSSSALLVSALGAVELGKLRRARPGFAACKYLLCTSSSSSAFPTLFFPLQRDFNRKQSEFAFLHVWKHEPMVFAAASAVRLEAICLYCWVSNIILYLQITSESLQNVETCSKNVRSPYPTLVPFSYLSAFH